MIAYARLTPGAGWRPFRALLYYAHRLGVATPMGRAIANGIAALIAVRHPVSKPLKADALLDQLRRDGYALLPPLLPTARISEMLAYLAGRQPVGGAALADYELADVINCPHVMDLANHPRLLSLAASYLGCAPTISTIGIRWSYPSAKAAAVQSFHRDPDDWKMVKFFTYLTDVAEGAGPHVFVSGTHRDRLPMKAARFSDAEIAHKYGDRAVTIQGPSGAMFMADTSGIHKGAPAIDAPRLMLEVGYTLLPVFALDYRPAPLTPSRPDLDRYINRLIVQPG
jgi:hypothetical protein